MREDFSLENIKEIFTNYLRSKELRKTPERFAILERVYMQEDHFDAEFLYKLMQEDYRVSLATIYNTLELLLSCRLIVKHQFGGQIAQYEKTFGNAIHNHLVCTKCGQIKEFSDKKLKTHIQRKRFAQFDVSYYSLYLYGMCKKCSEKSKSKKK